jgi:hypothetical protein
MSEEDRPAASCLPVGGHTAHGVGSPRVLTDPALIEKMITLQKLYADLDRQSRCDASVPRATLTADQFYNDYFYPNRPVILEGLIVTYRWTGGSISRSIR